VFYSEIFRPDTNAESAQEIPIPNCSDYVVFTVQGQINYTTLSSSNPAYQFGPQGNNVAGLTIPLTFNGRGGISGYKGPRLAQVGVFLGLKQPTTPPATIDFSASGVGTNFATLSPVLGQIFYIGNGYPTTSDQDGYPETASQQQTVYNVPQGARYLYLGFAMGTSATPGSYAA